MARARRKPYDFAGVRIYPPKGNGSWRAVIFDDAGNRRDRMARTQDGIEAIATEAAAMLAERDPRAAVRHTVAELAADYLSTLSGSYWARQEGVLRLWILPQHRDGIAWPGIGNLDMTTWTEAASERVIAAARASDRIGSGRVADIGSAMRALVTRAHRLRWLPRWEDPMLGVRYHARTTRDYGEAEVDRAELPTTDDVMGIVKALERMGEHRWSIAAELAAKSGLRWGELSALRPCDIGFSPNRVIRVTRSVYEDDHGVFHIKAPKNGRRRETIFPRSLEARLREHCDAVAAEFGTEALLFPGTRPDRFASDQYFRRRWAKAAMEAGWPIAKAANPKFSAQVPTPVWSVNDVRHYFACWMLFDVEVDIALVSRYLGHASIAFTLTRYVGVRGDPAAQGTALTEDW